MLSRGWRGSWKQGGPNPSARLPYPVCPAPARFLCLLPLVLCASTLCWIPVPKITLSFPKFLEDGHYWSRHFIVVLQESSRSSRIIWCQERDPLTFYLFNLLSLLPRKCSCLNTESFFSPTETRENCFSIECICHLALETRIRRW